MNNKKHRYSQITSRIFRQYVLSILAIPILLMVGFFFAWLICSLRIWQESVLYDFLKTLQYLSPYIILFSTLAGLAFFTYRAITKPLYYLDDMIEAAKKLSHPEEGPIQLPQELRDVENELNLVREQSLRNFTAAREAEQRKNDLIVYLAHDLKTPLTSVIGYLTLLAEEPSLTPEMRGKYTGIALDKALRLEDLINEFFDITRFNLTTLSLDAEPTNLSRMLEQTANEFHPIMAEKSLSWQLAIETDVQILCDRDKMARVFDNLIRNAINYSYPESKIALSMNRSREAVEITVKNSGKTIPPEKLECIFEQFFRLDTARSSATGGSGLGLAIAREIVELHGGSITASSDNECICFTIRLPAVRQ